MVRGNQRSDCVSYVIRMSMDAVTSPMENAHEVSGIVGKETRILGSSLKDLCFFTLCRNPPASTKYCQWTFLFIFFYNLQAIRYKHCSAIYVVFSYSRTYVISPNFLFLCILLPPANEVWGKVMFLHLCVILFTWWGIFCPSMHHRSHDRGSLSRGSLSGRDPRVWSRVGGTHPTGMHSCLFIYYHRYKHDMGIITTRGRPETSYSPAGKQKELIFFTFESSLIKNLEKIMYANHRMKCCGSKTEKYIMAFSVID